jgi:hypothetical protein
MEMFDLTKCQRPDGTIYGSRGKCRKGKPVETVGKSEKASVAPSRAKKTPVTPPRAKETPVAPSRAKKTPVTPPRAAIKEMLKSMGVKSMNPDQRDVFRKILSSRDTRDLGRIVRKLENGYMEDSIGKVSIGFIRSAKKEMKSWLEVNQRTGIGVAEEKRRESMSPEELRRARTADAISRGIRSGVVRAR